MKVTDTPHLDWVKKPGKESAAGKGQGEFQSVLDEAMEVSPCRVESRPGPVQGPGGPLMPQSVQPVRQAALRPDAAMVASHLKETLDLVDFYAARLGDPAMPVGDLEPLVDRLEEQMLRLERIIASNAVGADRLGAMVKDLTVTVGAEIAKFRRGDYG